MDKVSDLLIRMKNSYMASKKEVIAPYSKLSAAICDLLVKEGFLDMAKVKEREIVITLRYKGKVGAITNVKRISKPGRRVYSPCKSLPKVLDGLGVAIVSTPYGMMTDRQARKENIGGEVMAFVW